jgi:2-polyprenyl-3-methyl-5-hydroxy-6-metoxy-1,4-benzoquinol methylase
VTTSTIEEHLAQYVDDPAARKRLFFRYYSAERSQHQFKQLELLRSIEGSRLTEIGSYLGFSTALFMAAGFKVRTIDAAPARLLGEISPEAHTVKNILDITPDDLRDQDVIVCCETLEHLEFPDVEKVLRTFRDSGSERILISAPYRCLSIDVRITRHPFASLSVFRYGTSLIKSIIRLNSKKRKVFKPHPAPWGHKWELGFKGYPLEKLTRALREAGFTVEKQDYLGTARSVFLLARRSA